MAGGPVGPAPPTPHTCAAGTWYGVESEAVGAPGAVTVAMATLHPTTEATGVPRGAREGECVVLRTCGVADAMCAALAHYCDAHGGHQAAAYLRRRTVTEELVPGPA